VLLKTSVASMTSRDMIKLLASMTSTASYASKIKISMHFTCRLIFLASGISEASMTSSVSTTSAASMTSSPSFHQKNY
jgi:hypothetical protein